MTICDLMHLLVVCVCVCVQVRVAIHVKPESDIGKWIACTDKIQYTSNIKSLLTIYPTLM